MDISNQRPKGHFITSMPIILFLILIIPHCTSVYFSFDGIHCSCFNRSADCSGILGKDTIEDILSHLHQNCSSTDILLDLTLKIEELHDLPEESFKAFKLQNLTIGYGIEMLNSESFDGLESSLLSLNLSYNDVEFQSSPFSKMEKLKELHLDYNNIANFDVSIFENLHKLEFLSLSGNLITTLNSNFFENMTAIQTLILDNNKKITSISDINIVSSSLVNFSAKNCSISKSLEKDSLSGIPNLKYADFSFNNLTQVNAYALDGLHNLKTLNLSHNEIEILKDNCFSSLYNLVELDLRSNGIFQIELHAFVNLTELKILDLAENALEVISENYTSDLKSLEKFNLENNKLKRIIAGSFSTCIHLKKLFLEGNAFDCSVCEDTKYMMELLNNDTLFEREEADAITCELPEELEGTPLTNVSIDMLEEGYCSEDYSDSTTDITSTTETIVDEFTMTPTGLVSNSMKNVFNTDSNTPISSTLDEKTDTPQIITDTPEAVTSPITNSFLSITTLVNENTTESKEITFPKYYESTNVTTELTPMGNTESEVTEKIETLTSTEAIILSTPEISTARETKTETTFVASTAISGVNTMPLNERDTTEKDTATEGTTLFVSDHTTEEKLRTVQSAIELITLSTTKIIDETTIPSFTETTPLNKFASTSIVDTPNTEGTTTFTPTSITIESSTVAINKTDENAKDTSPYTTVRTKIIDETTVPSFTETTLFNKFASTSMVDTPNTEVTTISTPTSITTESSTVAINKTDENAKDTSPYTTVSTTRFSKKISDSQLVRIKDYTISDADICVRWDLKWEILSKQWVTNKLRCGVEVHHSRGKEFEDFKKCPTNDHEIHECLAFENKYLNNMYKFCLNVYITPSNKLKSCSKYHSLTTTEKSYKYSTSNRSLNSVPTTQETFVPFKVLKFDVMFNYSNSFAIANWIVNKNERNSICSLYLILMSHNFNYTEGVFACKNNSYTLQNIKQHETFQVCLRNIYRGYYAPLLCQSSVALSYEFKASSMKDDGYRNSALIAVICLLILVALIIIVLLLKKILKKRNISDLYNVSAEEKNVLRRTSASIQREPCVRYSYTLKEQVEV